MHLPRDGFSASRGPVVAPAPAKAPGISPAHGSLQAPKALPGSRKQAQLPQGPAAGSVPGKFQSRPPAPSRVRGPRGCAKPVPASALHGVYKPLSDLGLDVAGTPNARDRPLRLRAAWDQSPWERVKWAGSVPGPGAEGQGGSGRRGEHLYCEPPRPAYSSGSSFQARGPCVHSRITWRAVLCLCQSLLAGQFNQHLGSGTPACGCRLLR